MTRNQLELLNYIKAYILAHGYAPSFEEMRQATGKSSKSHIFQLVRGLELQGQIVRLPNRTRAIEIPERPEMPRNLTGFSDSALAHEVRRRGYIMGHIHRNNEGRRTFKEYDPKLDIPA